MRMPHQPTATLSPSLVHPHRRRCPIPFCNLLTLSSFHHLAFLSCPSLTCPPLFFFPSQPFAPIIILPFVSLALSPALPFFLLVTPFFPLFLKTLFTFFSLLLFSLSISAFIIEKLSFLLISYCRFSRHVLSLSLQIYIRRDSNYIITAVAHLFQTKKSFDLYHSFMSTPFLIAASHPFFSVPSFLDHCSLFSETSHHHISWFPTCDAALYLFIPSFFYETLIACSIV